MNDKSTLFVGNPSVNSDIELRALFQEYGLIYSAKLLTYTPPIDTQNSDANSTQTAAVAKPYGLVTYYSISHAQQAFKAFRLKAKRQESSIYVHFSRKRKREDAEYEWQETLPIRSSVELANYFIGPQNWSSQIEGGLSGIVPIKVEECSEEVRQFAEKRFEEISGPGQKGKPVAMAYKATVSLRFEGGKFSIGEGQGMAIAMSMQAAIPMAKKIAVTHARKAAFSKVVIVNYHGKIGVRVLAKPPGHVGFVNESDIGDTETSTTQQPPSDQPTSSEVTLAE